MRQWFRLDRLGAAAYLAVLSGCAPSAPPALVPNTAQAVSTEQVAEWVAGTRPTAAALHRFKWLFRDDRSSSGGRGSARVVLPDSLRFDVAGPLGVGKASAMVVGDSAVWVEPERSVQDLVPNFPLLWAMFGVARLPGYDDRVTGLVDGNRTAWQYVNGPDTVAYLLVAGSPSKLLTEVRHAGTVVGRAEATLSPEGTPLKARLTVPSAPARLDITFYSSVPTAAFPPDIWVRPSQ